MDSTLVPMIGTPAASRAWARLSGVWPPNWTMIPCRLHPVADVQHVLGGQRLEEEMIAGVVIGGDGLRVGVDHDGFEAGFAASAKAAWQQQ